MLDPRNFLLLQHSKPGIPQNWVRNRISAVAPRRSSSKQDGTHRRSGFQCLDICTIGTGQRTSLRGGNKEICPTQDAVGRAPRFMTLYGALQPEPCDAPSLALLFAQSLYCTHTSISCALRLPLTDNQLAVVREVVLGDLEVKRGGSFPDAAGDVVVGTVAGAEPAAEVAGLADGHATQVCADACFPVSTTTSSHRKLVQSIPSMTSHSGFLTRWSSVSGSLNEATLTLLASSISDAVRWRMKTGLPRHLMMTCGVFV